jgi:DNA-binding CsgD family transcriptional regulator/PAS domain-containing protein
MISTEKLSALIGAIYDCAVAPDRWEATLQSIRTELCLATAVLAVNPLPAGDPTIFATSGIAPEWLGRMWGYGEETLELWGGPARISQFPLDEPMVQSHATDRATWKDNRWITEWGYPQGLWDAVGFAFARDAKMIGNLTFGRHRTAGEVGDAELTALRLIAPHVRRAVGISHLLDLKTMEAVTFASALETLTVGVVLVDEHLGIVHANAAAGAMLRARDPIRSERGRLTLTYAAATEALQTSVAVAARNEMDLGRRGIGIPMRRADGTPCVAHVMPLRAGQIRPGIAQRAPAAVFVAPAESPPRMPADALALLYDLTPAESLIFELIANGQTPSEIAAMLGIAASTVKTHLLRVFDKTGCRRQADLVKLAASMSLPV